MPVVIIFTFCAISLLFSAAILFSSESSYLSAAAISLIGDNAIKAIFYLNLSAVIALIYFLFIHFPKSRRLWLNGVILGLSLMAASVASGVIGLSVNAEVGMNDIKILAVMEPQESLLVLIVCAFFTIHCMKKYTNINNHLGNY